MKRVQKVENRLFLCESTKFLIYFYSNHIHSSFIGIGLLKVIFSNLIPVEVKVISWSKSLIIIAFSE